MTTPAVLEIRIAALKNQLGNERDAEMCRKITAEINYKKYLLNKKWLSEEEEGIRADLRDADLRGVNYKNLSGVPVIKNIHQAVYAAPLKTT